MASTKVQSSGGNETPYEDLNATQALLDSVLPRADRFSSQKRQEYAQTHQDKGEFERSSIASSHVSTFTEFEQLLKALEEDEKLQQEHRASFVSTPNAQDLSAETDMGPMIEKAPAPPILQPRLSIRWEGYLLKRSDWLKHWEVYYFVLNGRTLTCFPSEQEAQEHPGSSKIKDGAFSFAEKGIIHCVYDIPNSNTKSRSSSIGAPSGGSFSRSSDRDSTGMPPPYPATANMPSPPMTPSGGNSSFYRFDFEINKGKRIHLQAPNEAVKQTWMFLANDGILNTELQTGRLKPEAKHITVGLEDYFDAFQFFCASLSELVDNDLNTFAPMSMNSSSSSSLSTPVEEEASGLKALAKSLKRKGSQRKLRPQSNSAMLGSTVSPKKDRLILRFFSLLHTDVILKSNYLPMVPFSGTYVGYNGILEFFTNISRSVHYQKFHVNQIKMHESQLLAVGSGVEAMILRDSLRPFTQQWIHKLKFRADGRIYRIEINGDAVASSVLFHSRSSLSHTNIARLTLPPLAEGINESFVTSDTSRLHLTIGKLQATQQQMLVSHPSDSFSIRCFLLPFQYGSDVSTKLVQWKETMEFNQTFELFVDYISKDDSRLLQIDLCRHFAPKATQTYSSATQVIATTIVNIAYCLNRQSGRRSCPSTYTLSNDQQSFVGKVCVELKATRTIPTASIRQSRRDLRRSRCQAQFLRAESLPDAPRPTLASSTLAFQPSMADFDAIPSPMVTRHQSSLGSECSEDSPSANEGIRKTILANTCFALDRKYKVVKIVGKGTYGVVIAATDSVNGGTFAIKKIGAFLRHLKLTTMTLREIKLMRILGSHPCLMGLHDLQKPSDYQSFEDLYIIQPLMESDLCRLIYSTIEDQRSRHPAVGSLEVPQHQISDEHIQYFMYQILCGIQFMHSANVLHRDLKPSNILVNSDCTIKICDFGLARHLTETTRVGEEDHELSEYVVTRWYRAPELLLANVYEKSIDIWSIGCIFAELLGRKVMFPGRSYVNQLKMILQIVGTPASFSFCKNPNARRFAGREFLAQTQAYPKVPWTQIFPSANPEALDLLDRLLQFDPRDRITAAQALNHPYFKQWHDDELEQSSSPIQEQTNFNHKELSPNQLKSLLYHEVMTFGTK